MVPLKIQLPADFLNEETRCDYTISSKMKEVWAVQLDMLEELDRVCKKHNIAYFASYGTMLGAVRHKGFIPWDDDIDLMMLRSEYDKLCAVAQDEFKEPYFFQTEWTDRSSLRGHAQLRNSLTTGILVKDFEKKYRFNQGIFLDIFPLDAVTDDDEEFDRLSAEAKRLKKKYMRRAFLTDRFYIPKEKGIDFIPRCIVHTFLRGPFKSLGDYQKIYREYEALCTKHNNDNTEKLGLLGFCYDRDELRFRADFEESIELPFEFTTVPVPKNYDHALRQIYGNYMEFVKSGTSHGGIIYDTDRPYTFYLNQGNYNQVKMEEYYHH